MANREFSQDPTNPFPGRKASAEGATGEMKAQMQEPVSSAAQTVPGVAPGVSHKAQGWAANLADKAQETASAAVDKTDDGIAAVGQQMKALGGSVRKVAPQAGVIGSAATSVADQLQAGGRYLEGHGLQDMGKDLTAVVRRYPIPSVLVGVGIGYLLGTTLRRS